MTERTTVVQKEMVDMEDGDFANSAVPLEARKSFLSITIVWLGFVFCVCCYEYDDRRRFSSRFNLLEYSYCRRLGKYIS